MDLGLSEKEQLLLSDLDHYFQDFGTDCPYGLPRKAIYRMARFSVIPEHMMEILLAGGFRRYGNTVYKMRCRDCSSCVPIMLNPVEFSPNRSQKRSARDNTDLLVRVITVYRDSLPECLRRIGYIFPPVIITAVAYLVHDGIG